VLIICQCFIWCLHLCLYLYMSNCFLCACISCIVSFYYFVWIGYGVMHVYQLENTFSTHIIFRLAWGFRSKSMVIDLSNTHETSKLLWIAYLIVISKWWTSTDSILLASYRPMFSLIKLINQIVKNLLRLI
jgi:hypothetical protein